MTATKLLKAYLVALFVVFLYYGRQIACCSKDIHRYFGQWSHRDALAIIVGVLVPATCAFGLYLLVRWARSDVPARVFNHVFLIVLIYGLFALSGTRFFVLHPKAWPVMWAPLLAVIGYSLVKRKTRLVRYAYNVCLAFSPVVVIVFAQMLCWPAWRSWREPPVSAPVQANVTESKPPVFVFVFDEWSYDRSTAQGRFHAYFHNLQKLCNQSILFRRARSPYPSTEVSIPRMIYQSEKAIKVDGGRPYFRAGDGRVMTSDAPSLFGMARDQGYNTAVMGVYLPYRKILGSQVDCCREYAYEPKGDDFLEAVLYRAFDNIKFWRDPLSRYVWRNTFPKVRSEYWFEMNNQCRDDVLNLIDTWPDNTFAFIHWPFPHHPFIFNADGSYHGPFHGTEPRIGTPDEYDRHLQFLDRLIGRVIGALKASGKFEQSLIVITSDHSWREDPDPSFRQEPEWECRVPLVIKLPGQQSGMVIDDELRTNRLQPLFEAVFAGEQDTERLVDLVRALPAKPNTAVCRSSEKGSLRNVEDAQ